MPAPPVSLPHAIPDSANSSVQIESTKLTSDTMGSASDSSPWSVEKALREASIDPPESSPATSIPFLHMIERLKTTPREGWRRFTIAPGESISDHMYRMAIITLLAPPSLASKLDLNRCTKMALVHDMGEALVGDITPVDGVSKDEKSRRETLSMDYLLGRMLGNTAAGENGTGAAQTLRGIWQEYEDSKTPESKFVHDVDKLELILQMVEYERRYKGRIDLGEFVWVAGRVELDEMKVWVAELLAERERFWESQGKGRDQVENWGMGEKLRAALGTEKKLDAMVTSQNGHSGA